ncbi:MAG: hypothetical protein HYT80_10790, partial [Euryarchaeota archaeon]|nr:hypothetical protein [Euryarchaeota archaeon]
MAMVTPVPPVQAPEAPDPEPLRVKWEATLTPTLCAMGYCQGPPSVFSDDKVGRFVEHKPGAGVAKTIVLDVKWSETPAPAIGPTQVFASVHCMVPTKDYYCQGEGQWQLAFAQETAGPFKFRLNDLRDLPANSFILIRFGVLPRDGSL